MQMSAHVTVHVTCARSGWCCFCRFDYDSDSDPDFEPVDDEFRSTNRWDHHDGFITEKITP